MTRNLLTDRQSTLNAMAEIEGEDWLAGEVEDREPNCNLAEVDAVLADGPLFDDGEPASGVAVIYGVGGGNRWIVDGDGGVRFSALNAQTYHIRLGLHTREDVLAHVRGLGFRAS